MDEINEAPQAPAAPTEAASPETPPPSPVPAQVTTAGEAAYAVAKSHGFTAAVLEEAGAAWAAVERDCEFVVDAITGAVKRAEAGMIAIFHHDGTVDVHPAEVAADLHPEISNALFHAG